MVSVPQVEGEYSFLSKNSTLDQYEGVRTHLYRLGTEQRGNDAIEGFAYADQGSSNLLDSILLSQWEDFSWKGQLGYDVTTCKLKITTGERKFVVQLNDKWNSFFLKEFDNKFYQRFGCMKPNCMENYKELLLCIAQGEKDRPEVVPSTIPPKDGVLLIANVYPVEYGHIFLVPSATTQQSSRFWDKTMFSLIIKIACEVNSSAFRVCFDDGTSISPDCSIFQASYFANPLPVESASTVIVYNGITRSGILISETVDYPLKALVFMGNNFNTLIDVVSDLSSTLHDRNAAYSLLISNCGTKMFLFPQVQNPVTGCFLSAWECGGYFVYHTKLDFDRASETEISNRMASVSLQDDSFEELKHLCCAIAVDLVI